MRLHEIQDPPVDKLRKAFADISKRCRQITEFYKDNWDNDLPQSFFYHGTSNHGTTPVYRARSVSERGPKDTPVELHDKLVEFMAGLGLAAHRGNSLFMSSDYKAVQENYGRPFIIFPVDDFKYTWSATVKDVYEELETKFNLAEIMRNLDPGSLSDIKWFEQHYAFREDNLAGALQSGHEVMVAGEYYAINSTYINEIIYELLENFK